MCFFSEELASQVSYTKTSVFPKKIASFDPDKIVSSFKPSIQNMEAPVPGGTSYRSHLLELKKKVREKYPIIQDKSFQNITNSLDAPVYLDSFRLKYYFLVVNNGDTLFDEVKLFKDNGVPLDNTLAISNDDYLMCGINSKLYTRDLKTGYDVKNANISVIRFEDFASESGINTDNPFDPKIIYDPNEDRFIATFLSGRTPKTSKLIIGFSTSGNPNDPWNVYSIPGNPYKNNLWSDYPAIMLTEKEVFYTINLLVPSNDWKIAFSETVIWQIDKESGYSGADSLTTQLWGDIALDGRNLRNLAVVPGADGLKGPNAYFLSNRNFDIENDTTFLVEITNSIDNSAVMNITPLIAEKKYGLPPNGRQKNSDANDPEDGFDTNDARILGAFLEEKTIAKQDIIEIKNSIQFVGNSVNPETGFAAVYHGVITDLKAYPKIKANIIGDSELDFGYPNIAFTGNDKCGSSSIIAFNHTSPNVFAGVSAVRFSIDSNGDWQYSDRMTVKEGENYVNRHAGTYERWGDYFGLQRKYNEAGIVHLAGFFGTKDTLTAGTWYAKLRDCDCFNVSVDVHQTSDYNVCLGQIEAIVENGFDPLTYVWNGQASSSPLIDVNLCDDDYTLIVSDDKGCTYSKNDSLRKSVPVRNKVVFPNPTHDKELNVYFEVNKKTRVSVYIYNSEGKLVKQIIDQQTVESGKNLLSFSLAPLSRGMYIVQIKEGEDELMSEKIIIP